MEEYSAVLYESYKQASFENKQSKKTWSFWNAVFYCGTIYTTIGKSTMLSTVKWGVSIFGNQPAANTTKKSVIQRVNNRWLVTNSTLVQDKYPGPKSSSQMSDEKFDVRSKIEPT